MKNCFILYFLVMTSLTACVKRNPLSEKISVNEAAKTFVIKKGSHTASGNNFQLFRSASIHCEVTFDSSAIYHSLNPENQEDVNKLIGFSDCNDEHHQNSARLGWSWNGEAVCLYVYAYLNGERVIRHLANVNVNQPIDCSLTATDNQYFFSAGNARDSLTRHCIGYSGVHYMLYPYFGGDEVAPHDIRIIIKGNF